MTATRAALLGVFAACLLTAIDARPSIAETYRPWCVQYSGRGIGTTCTFTSYAQCMMTAGPGTGGYCVQNPWYLSYGPDGSGGRDRRR